MVGGSLVVAAVVVLVLVVVAVVAHVCSSPSGSARDLVIRNW
jgi:hypothetical protein